MAPKGIPKGMGKARERMPTAVIKRLLSLDRDRQTEFISGHIRGLRQIYTFGGVKDERAWDLINNIIFLHPVPTHNFSKSQLMGPHSRSRSSPFGSGGQPSVDSWCKCLTKPLTKWTIGGQTTPVTSGIRLIAPMPMHPSLGRLHAPASVSIGMVVMIPTQIIIRQTAGSTGQATSWPLFLRIGIW